MIVSMKSFEVVRDARLSGRDREVLDYLLLHVEFGNVSVDLSTQEMALVLGTSAPVVSRSLLKLESSGLIDRGQRGVVHMNPELWFKGGAKEQAAAVFKWHQRMRRAQRKRSKAAA
jgi:predicted transcriptional regulator